MFMVFVLNHEKMVRASKNQNRQAIDLVPQLIFPHHFFRRIHITPVMWPPRVVSQAQKQATNRWNGAQLLWLQRSAPEGAQSKEWAWAGHWGKEKEPLGWLSGAESQQIPVCHHHANDRWLQFKQENNFTYVLNYSLLASYFSMKLKQFTSFLMDYRRNSSIMLLLLYDQYL